MQWCQVASERKTARLAQKGTTKLRETSSGQGTATALVHTWCKSGSAQPKIEEDAHAFAERSRNGHVGSAGSTKQSWSQSIREDFVKVVELSHRQNGRNRLFLITGGPHGDCNFRLVYREQEHLPVGRRHH